jgi:hypothetical protein
MAAILNKALQALLKSLGKIPEDVGALKNIPDNQNLIQSPLPEGGKFSYINQFGEVKTEDPGKIDFYLYSDDPEEGLVGSKFINQTMNNELVNSLEKGNYQDSRAYMDSVQKKFEEFGATDSESDHIIDSILSNYFEGID